MAFWRRSTFVLTYHQHHNIREFVLPVAIPTLHTNRNGTHTNRRSAETIAPNPPDIGEGTSAAAAGDVVRNDSETFITTVEEGPLIDLSVIGGSASNLPADIRPDHFISTLKLGPVPMVHTIQMHVPVQPVRRPFSFTAQYFHPSAQQAAIYFTAAKHIAPMLKLNRLKLSSNSVRVAEIDVDMAMGRGSFGQVAAYDTVAYKLISGTGRSFAEQMVCATEELVIMGKLSHPAIVGMYQAFVMLDDEQTKPPISIMFMEMGMGDLHHLFVQPYWQAEHNKRRFYLMKFELQMLEAIAHLHGHGLVHSDIKPENMILFLDDKGDVTIKLGDLGACTNGVLHRSTSTPHYQAPEGFMHNIVGQRSDIWSWAAAFWLGHTATLPFNTTKEIFALLGAPRDPLVCQHLIAKKYMDPTTRHMTKEPEWNHFDSFNVMDNFRDIIKSIFRLNPAERPTAQSLITHPRYIDMHNLPRCTRKPWDPPERVVLTNRPSYRCRFSLRPGPDVDFFQDRKYFGMDLVRRMSDYTPSNFYVHHRVVVGGGPRELPLHKYRLRAENMFEIKQRMKFFSIEDLNPERNAMAVLITLENTDAAPRKVTAALAQHYVEAIKRKITGVIPVYSLHIGVKGYKHFLIFITHRHLASVRQLGLVNVESFEKILLKLFSILNNLTAAGVTFPILEFLSRNPLDWILINSRTYDVYLDVPGYLFTNQHPGRVYDHQEPLSDDVVIEHTTALTDVLSKALCRDRYTARYAMYTNVPQQAIVGFESTISKKRMMSLSIEPPDEQRNNVYMLYT